MSGFPQRGRPPAKSGKLMGKSGKPPGKSGELPENAAIEQLRSDELFASHPRV